MLLRFCSLSGCLLLAACAALDAVHLTDGGDDLTGEYVHDHDISYLGEKDWEEGTVRDSLSLRQMGDSLQIHFMLVHTNFHTCEMVTTAFQRDGDFETVPEPIEFGGSTGECVLRVTASSDSIVLHDIDDQCRRTYCGARGYIGGTVFHR